MPLSKNHTLVQIRGLLLLWMQELNISGLDPDLVNDFINLATMDVFADLKDTIYKLYGRSTNLADSGSCYGEPVTGASFVSSTKTVTKTAHGLTGEDIGKRILFHGTDQYTTEYLAISNIVSILTENTFTILNTLFGNSTDLSYSVIPRHSELQLDLSDLRIFEIRKLNDDVNGEYVEVVDARDFENLYKYPQKQNKIYYYKNGEIVKLFKGSNVTAFGTILMDYFGYPDIPAAETDYLDIPDQHIGLVIQKAQNYIISHKQKSGLPIPVETKQNTQRETNANAQSQIAAKK